MDLTLVDVLGLACRLSAGPLVALALAAGLRRRSAALRHNVLAAGLAGSLLAPPAAAIVPSWGLTAAWSAEPAQGRLPARARGGAPAVSHTSSAAGPRRPEGVGSDLNAELGPVAVMLWLAGATLGLVRLVLAGRALRRLTADADRLTDGPWVKASTGFGSPLDGDGVTIYCSAAVAAPSTFGVRRPAVIVPEGAQAWQAPRVRAVLCHELAHVARRDWFVHIVADVVVALQWFNPVIHLTRTRLQRESEQACDDAVLASGATPREYAGHLLAIARAGRLAPAPAGAVPMANPSTLERRITAMLTPDIDRRAPSRSAAVAMALALLAVTLPFAGFKLHAQGGPSSVTGIVYDPSGGVLPGVEVTLEDAQRAKFSSVTDGTGRFEFGPLDPGDYRLETTLAGFRPVRLALTLSAGQAWNRVVTMNVGTLQETITVKARRPAAARPSAPAPGTPVRVGGNIRPPRKVFDVRPLYPEPLREAGVEGTVRLDALIGVDGGVVSVRPVSADVHPAFLKAAADAVQQWRFTSTLLNGVPVEVAMDVSISFGLSD